MTMHVDLIISLGGRCQVAHQIRRRFTQFQEAHIFDWFLAPLASIERAIEDDLCAFTRPSSWIAQTCDSSFEHQHVMCAPYGILSIHDFKNHQDIEGQCATVLAKFAYLTFRWEDMVTSGKRILFIHQNLPGVMSQGMQEDRINSARAAQFLRKFQTKYQHIDAELLLISRGNFPAAPCLPVHHYVMPKSEPYVWQGDDAAWDSLWAQLDISLHRPARPGSGKDAVFDQAAFAVGRQVPIRPAAELGRVLGSVPGGGPYRRAFPVVRGPVSDWNSEQRQLHEGELVQAPDCQVVELDNGVVLYGLVFTRDGTLVRESLINREYDEVFLGLRRTAAEMLVIEQNLRAPEPLCPGRYVLLSQLFDGDYAHWLLDCLPKMAAICKFVDLAETYFVLSWHPAPRATQIMQATLSYFGIAPSRILYRGAELQPFEKLIYATPLTRNAWVNAPLAVMLLEELAVAIGTDNAAPDRIVIVPPDNEGPFVSNDATVRAALRDRGFVEVYVGEMSFEQQVRAVSRARYVAGRLNSALTNVVFAPKGVRLLCFAHEDAQDDFYWDLVSHKRGQFFSLHGSKDASSNAPDSYFDIKDDDLTAILEEFAQA